MKQRIENLETKFEAHLKEYAVRGEIHKENNRIQSEFATEINKLNAQIAQQGLILGQQGVTLGRHENLFEEMKSIWEKIAEEMGDMKKYIAIAEDRLSFKRYLLDVFFKSIPIISFGLIILYKIW